MTHAAPRRLSARRLAAGALIVALAGVPVIAALSGQSFYVTLVSRMMIFALAAVGLNLIVGYGAMVSFGHALYIGVGAYTVGIMADRGIVNGWAHLGVALGVGALLATVIGLVCLRAAGIGFIMITLAFAQMLYFLAVGLKAWGGDDGLRLNARSDFGVLDLGHNTVLYYVIFGVLMAVLWGLHRLIHARFGMALQGCRLNERRMKALGVETLRIKLAAYVMSALVCVVAGLLLANLTRFVSPSYMQWSVSGELIVMLVLGGVGTLIGPVIGAVVWLTLEELLSSFSLGLPGQIDELLRTHWMGLLGLIALAVALLLNRGLYGLLVQHDEEPR